MKKTDFKNMIKESIKEVLIEEGLLAYENKAVGLHAIVDVRHEGEWIKKTTVGRIIFNSILPEDVGYVNAIIDKNELTKIVTNDSTSPIQDTDLRVEHDQAMERAEQQRAKLVEMRKNMMDSIGKSSYKDIYNLNGVNLFEGTTPLKSGGTPGAGPSTTGPLSDVEPSDPGVDISSLMGNANLWKELLKK